MAPKKKGAKPDIFGLLCTAVLLLAVAFIVGSLCAILPPGLSALPQALQSDEIWFSLQLSLKTAAVSTLICVAIAIPSAYALTRTRLPGKKLFQILIDLPMSLPYLVLGLCLLLFFSSEFGKMLKQMGFRVVFDVKGIVIAHLIVNLPFVIRMVVSAIQQLDPRREMVARMLGASKFRSFLCITLPLARNAILVVCVTAWSRAIGEFGATLMLVGVTRMKTETLPASIYLNISTGNNELAMASAMVLLGISCLSSGAARLLSRKSNSVHATRELELL